jgi:hypothetical protein
MEAATNTATAPKVPDKPSKPGLLEDCWNESEMCAQMDGIGLQTLRRMVNGPPYVKIRRRRHYPIDLAKKWLAKRVRGAR